MSEPPGNIWPVLRDIVAEPMFLLLVATSLVYSILGELHEALFMAAAIVMVSAISFFQDRRSRKALDTLKLYSRVKSRVIRNGRVVHIQSEDIVVGDFVVVEEGALIPADGILRQGNDFTVNESILTGEAFTVAKDVNDPQNNHVYQGTIVSSGLAVFETTEVGTHTKLGKIGKSLGEIREEKTPLQLQIETFVKRMAIAGVAVFLLIWTFNYVESRDLLGSLLKGLTIVMSILPEEIPVAFTTFMALGAWRLMQQGVIVKQIKTVETLGSATVICIDKTGTITENRMELQKIYSHARRETISAGEWNREDTQKIIEVAMWASEPIPFDPMEKALHDAYARYTESDQRIGAKMIYEYPLSGKPPIMTHVFKTASGRVVVAAKGAPETILRLSRLNNEEKSIARNHWASLAREGYRVLGVAEAPEHQGGFPPNQEQFGFQFFGFVAFFDPPKANIPSVVQDFYKAGLGLKIITGDNETTTSAIARQIRLKSPDVAINGEDLVKMDDASLHRAVATSNIFTRMFPEAKLRIVNALKDQDQVVAMTGDGVNDGPALKAAHIGIAMGKRGTEIAKQASALVLVDDDLSKMVDAIAMGRKIYGNLKKAIQYIISIHIPIILTVSVPLFLGWMYPDIFTPVHVIFLELIMGPTCSIVYENEPLEKKAMEQPPREMAFSFLSWHELRMSILQGLAITAGTLSSYQYAVADGMSEDMTRTMVFVTLIVANIFLTLANRSFYYSMLSAAFYHNTLMRAIILSTVALALMIVYTPLLNEFFHLEPLDFHELMLASLIGFLSVIWFEGYKYFKRLRSGVTSVQPR